MYNPAHPGKLIQEYLDGLKEEGTAISLAQLAAHIGITRTTLSRIVNGHQALTADIALRLHEALVHASARQRYTAPRWPTFTTTMRTA